MFLQVPVKTGIVSPLSVLVIKSIYGDVSQPDIARAARLDQAGIRVVAIDAMDRLLDHQSCAMQAGGYLIVAHARDRNKVYCP